MISLTKAARKLIQAARKLPALALLTLVSAPAIAQVAIDANTYAFNTSQGTIYVELRPDVAPKTVANFLAVVATGAYNSSFFHRLVPGFVLQGGGYNYQNGNLYSIQWNPTVVNEYSLPNVAGTLAMAHGTDPNSATSQFFFNLVDNTTALNPQGGDTAVFGQIVDPTGYSTAGASIAVLAQIGADQILDDSSANAAFNELPVFNYTGNTLQASNLVYVNSITQVQAATLPPPIISNLSASSVTSGQSVTATVQATGFASGVSVTFSCSALPADSTCVFSPTPSTTNANGTATSTVTIATGVKPAFVTAPGQASRGYWQLWPASGVGVFACCLLPFMRRRTRLQLSASLFGATTCAAFLLFFSGCSSGSSASTTTPTAPTYSTPAGTYPLLISVAGGSRSSSATLSLTVH